MHSKDIHPKWWQLYLSFPLLIVLFAVDSRLRVSTRLHQVVQIGIVVIVFGLIHLWVKANSAALSKMDQRPYPGKVIVTRISSQRLPGSGNEKQVLVILPDSEVKGMLNNTFEMDIIDAEAFPVKEVPQEWNKE